jgi:prepilin-type N-terminal cleavage/methylation domain-containing protein
VKQPRRETLFQSTNQNQNKVILTLSLANTKMNYIKTNNKWARQRGTTLIELSVVIAVILLLVGVLFIGVTAWKNGANKAAVMVQLSSIQKAVRGWENLNPAGLPAVVEGTTPLTPATASFVGATGFFATWPVDPNGVAYTNLGVVPTAGIPYSTSTVYTPTAAQTANW